MQHTKSISLFLIFLVSSLSVTAVETTQYDVTYDTNGNLVQGSSLYQEYDELNRLVRVRDGSISGQLIESYTYDDGTQRLTKTNHILNETTYYISDEFIEVRNATGTYLTVYAYDGNTLLGRKDPDGKLSFYHPDHLGSTDLMTDAGKNVVEQTTYDPYGRVRDGGETSDFLYTGKEKDDSGLYYYEARYYDSFFMRFTQADQNIPDVYDPQTLNRYSYVRNNPYKYVDPTGEVFILAPLLIRATIGFVAGFGLSVATQYLSTGKVNYKQATVAGVIGGVTSLTASALVLTQGALTLTKLGKNLGNTVISGFSGEVGGNIAQNIYEGKPALENSENVDSNQFIQGVFTDLALGTLIGGLESGKKVDLSTSQKDGKQTSSDKDIDLSKPKTLEKDTFTGQAQTYKSNQGTIHDKKSPKKIKKRKP